MSIKKNVTFIGLGTMGYPMAGHLSKSELFNVSVFNRSQKNAAQWEKDYEGRFAVQLKRP